MDSFRPSQYCLSVCLSMSLSLSLHFLIENKFQAESNLTVSMAFKVFVCMCLFPSVSLSALFNGQFPVSLNFVDSPLKSVLQSVSFCLSLLFSHSLLELFNWQFPVFQAYYILKSIVRLWLCLVSVSVPVSVPLQICLFPWIWRTPQPNPPSKVFHVDFNHSCNQKREIFKDTISQKIHLVWIKWVIFASKAKESERKVTNPSYAKSSFGLKCKVWSIKSS